MSSRNIKINREEYFVLYKEKQIRSRIALMAMNLKAYWEKDKTPLVLLKVEIGGDYFCADLSRELDKLKVDHYVETIRVKSYHDNKQRDNEITILNKPYLKNIKGKRVVIVEDLIDEGITMLGIINYLRNLKRPPAEIRVCALLVKRGHKFNHPIHYAGFKNVLNTWLFGYGMDLDNFKRGKKNIYAKIN